MDVLFLIGRILFAILFLGSAMNHFTQSKGMIGYTKARGVPLAGLAVPVTGVMLAAGGLSVLLGVWPDLGALLLIVFLLPTAVLMHGFWRESDPQTKQVEMIMFMKDIALAGAALMLFALVNQLDDNLGLSITGSLFGL